MTEKTKSTGWKRTTAFAMAAALALPLVLPCLSGCAYARRTGRSVQDYVEEEMGIVPGPVKRNHLELTSSNPADYILPDGTGIAIPAKIAEDYYISPFAPRAGYLSSRAGGGTKVIDPYSGRILILGEREYVAEKELE